MQAFISSVDRKQKQWFLAQLQGTRKAVLPVHTIAERKLFNEFMLTCRQFYISRTELTPEAVKLWNRKAETMPGVYYKLSEQLSQYASGDWQKTANIKQSLSQAFELTDTIRRQTRDPRRAESIINATETSLQPHHVTQGFDVGSVTSVSGTSNSGSAESNQTHPNIIDMATQISRQRTMDAQPSQAIKKQRNSRHCIRCGQAPGQCNGAGAWYRCQYPCRDCGEKSPKSCAGRDSKAPGKPQCGPLTELTPAARKHLGI
ncbi:hypothetical protein BT96DRAFT_1010633 [Gymnopus androsaceus JB14]|uniref:Uncharacterized protein n=1 Tax=Gymnopus androsaceus JB14 TaxID=1447944 RepID=A0A6A4GAD9_9AGAR|nr:hypothetical protein BT96DRAFT_1010633 [Gymnopus androsaceus JB14]